MIKTLIDNDYKTELGKNRISVVKVHANWCGPCKLLKSHYNRWSDNYKVYNDTEIKYYELDNDKNKKFIEEYKVKHLPSMLFFVYGVHVFTIRGMTRAKIFEGILQKTLDIKFEIKE